MTDDATGLVQALKTPADDRTRRLLAAPDVTSRTMGVTSFFWTIAEFCKAFFELDDVRIRLRFRSRLTTPRFRNFRLHDLDVQRVEDQAEVRELLQLVAQELEARAVALRVRARVEAQAHPRQRSRMAE